MKRSSSRAGSMTRVDGLKRPSLARTWLLICVPTPRWLALRGRWRESTEDWPRKANAAAGPAVYRWRALRTARGVRAIRDAGRALREAASRRGRVLAARPRVAFGDGRQNARNLCGRLA